MAVAWGDWMMARQKLPRGMGMTHGFLANMGGIRVYDPNTITFWSDDPDSKTPSGFFDAYGLQQLAQCGYEFESISESDIEDKSKGDSLVKTIAVLQALRLALDCIARSTQQLAISTLEIATLAYLPCSLLAYYFWWCKPLDVQAPIPVSISMSKGACVNLKSVQEMVDGSSSTASTSEADMKPEFLHFNHPPLRIKRQRYHSFPLAKKIWHLGMPNFKEEDEWVKSLPDCYFADLGFMVSLGSIAFGAVHFAAWNFEFKTPLERLLWRRKEWQYLDSDEESGPQTPTTTSNRARPDFNKFARDYGITRRDLTAFIQLLSALRDNM
ncbi:hypothetical protein CIB48_g4146 [Xylaria polymorpha]|nr:hypothetical protein CIB48_g4146 [Xylaria polymorpha]